MTPPRLAAALFVLALLPRAGAVIFASRAPVLSERVVAADSRKVYLPLAANVNAGLGFILVVDPTAPLTIPPVYPLWLASLHSLFGPPGPLAVGLLQALLRALAVVALHRLASRFLPPPAALAAAIAYALDPWEAFWTPYVLKESVAVPLLIVALAAWYDALAARSARAAAAAGAAMAVATLAWFGAALLAAWSLRRLWTHGSRRLTAAYLGAALLVGLGWAWIAIPAVPPQVWPQVWERVVLKFAGRPFDPAAPTAGYPPEKADYRVAADLRNLGQGDTKERVQRLVDPVPENVGRATVNLWRPVHAGSSRLTFVLFGIPYLALLGLALAGLVLARRERRDLGRLPSLLLLLVVALSLMSGGIRQRQYLAPLLALPAGLTLVRLAAPRRPVV
jgi:4-amino-4-deoxy-L-arabinose transferase-like glycosyltransferase